MYVIANRALYKITNSQKKTRCHATHLSFPQTCTTIIGKNSHVPIFTPLSSRRVVLGGHRSSEDASPANRPRKRLFGVQFWRIESLHHTVFHNISRQVRRRKMTQHDSIHHARFASYNGLRNLDIKQALFESSGDNAPKEGNGEKSWEPTQPTKEVDKTVIDGLQNVLLRMFYYVMMSRR